MTDDLIARLRALSRHEHSDMTIGDEAAAALEAAREDAERLDWLAFDAQMLSGWREHGTWETPALVVNSTREHCTPADFRAAIDAAREGRND